MLDHRPSKTPLVLFALAIMALVGCGHPPPKPKVDPDPWHRPAPPPPQKHHYLWGSMGICSGGPYLIDSKKQLRCYHSYEVARATGQAYGRWHSERCSHAMVIAKGGQHFFLQQLCGTEERNEQGRCYGGSRQLVCKRRNGSRIVFGRPFARVAGTRLDPQVRRAADDLLQIERPPHGVVLPPPDPSKGRAL